MSGDGSDDVDVRPDEPSESVQPSLPAPSRRRARRMAWLYTAAAVILLPWIIYLAETLPKRNLDHHYRAAWVGFDVLLIIAIIRTAYMAFRVDPRVQITATATATLLIVDAWFDITTSSGRGQVFEALVLAAVIEIPAALFSLYLARSVNRRVIELAHLEGLTSGATRRRDRRRRRKAEPAD